MKSRKFLIALLFVSLVANCVYLLGWSSSKKHKVGEQLKRKGQEIMVCGQLFHVGAPVVLWTDPGGYDAYRVERRFAPLNQSSWSVSEKKVRHLTTPNRYGMRKQRLTAKQIQKFRGGGWTLKALQNVVDQFVLHYDVCGTSQRCFKVLHDMRGLSVHFLLDIDGTIYQTLDLKERAWHATTSNGRSVGIEIAHIGSYPVKKNTPLETWYQKDSQGVRLVLPHFMGDGGVRTKNFVGRPLRPKPVVDTINGRKRMMYDLTAQQYRSLIKLTAALCKVFPKLKCDYPKDDKGKLIKGKLPKDELDKFQGILGHYHVQTNKNDPGPAFQWDLLVKNARKVMKRGR